jgi:mannose-6-phosphate isomerase-like protein (cupin superfamily)
MATILPCARLPGRQRRAVSADSRHRRTAEGIGEFAMSSAMSEDEVFVRGSGQVEGRDIGGSVSIILVSTDEPGAGPRLHRHSYDETFVVHRGEVEFTLGDEVVVKRAGQVAVAQAMVPHKFSNLGRDRLEMTNIHASPVIETEWLEDPD